MIRNDKVRHAFMAASLIATLVYLGYRGVCTLNCDGAYATFASLSLYLAECYGALLMVFYFVSIWKIVEPEPLEPLPDRTIDVFIPTFNEDPDLLRGTIAAALALDYPHRTYVLDDGRRPKVRELTERLGAIYIERPDNRHAKAGNLNHALSKTDGEFIVILDADHIAQRNFLVRLLGYFHDERLAFVQTPHSFYNFDNFQGTLDYSQQVYWEDGQLFYNVIQPGKNYWNAVTFCGSAAMFRRSALEEVGGVATETITEDMHTGIRLHARGWKSLFVNDRLVSGQAATDVTTFNTQRLRWGEGNLSIFAFDNPLTMPGLTLGQRINYVGAMLSWTTGVQKLLLYLAPMLMLITNVAPVRDFTWTLGAVTLAYLLTVWTAFKVVSNGYGHLLGMELTQMACFWTHVRATYRALFKRADARFVVTSKRGRQSNRLIHHIAPQCLLITGSAIAIACSTLRWWYGFTNDITCLAVGTGLLLFHCWFAWNVVRRALRARDLRFSWRHPAAMHVSYQFADADGIQRSGQAVSVDINERGLGVITMEDLSDIDQVELTVSAGGREARTAASVRLVQPVLTARQATHRGAQAYRVGFAFDDATEETLALIWWMAATYSVSRQYDRFDSGTGCHADCSVEQAVRQQVDHRSAIHLPVELSPCDGGTCRSAVSEGMERDVVCLTLADPLPEGSVANLSIQTPYGSVSGKCVASRPIAAHLCGEQYLVQACRFQSLDNSSRQVLDQVLGEPASTEIGRVMRYSPDEMELPTLRPGMLLGTAVAVAAAAAIAVNLWLLKDDILVARALANGSVSAEELEMLNEMTERLISDPAPNEHEILRVREVMRLTGNTPGLKTLDEFFAHADFTSFPGRLTSAQALDELGRHQAASELLSDLLGQRESLTDPEMLRELLVSAARNRTHLEQYDEALSFLEELAATGSDPIRYRQEYLSALAGLGDVERIEEIVGDENASDSERRFLASVLSATERFDRATQLYLEIAQDNPEDRDALVLAADNALWDGHFDVAARIYAKLLEAHPDDSDIRTKFARASLWAKQPQKALPVLAQIVHDGDASEAAIILYLEAAAASDALNQLQRRLILQIHEARNHYMQNSDFVQRLADAMARIGENEAAIPILEAIVAHDQGNHEMRLRLAESLRDAGRLDEAELHYQRLLAESQVH